MPDFSFLEDDNDNDGLPRIRVNTSRPRGGRKTKPIVDQLDDLAAGLDGCGKAMRGCGCLLIILGLLLGLPFILAVL
jgi:hypothetical protein